MSQRKFLCIQRSQQAQTCSDAAPTPEQREAMMAKFITWKTHYESQIVDMGGRLGAGSVVRLDSVSDGPYAESPDVAGGYMIVTAESMEDAVKIAQESPGIGANSCIEVREINHS